MEIKIKSTFVIFLVFLIAVLLISIYRGSMHHRWWRSGMEGFSNRPELTPREQELFEDLSNNRLSEDEIMKLVNSGVINDNLIKRFLGQMDEDTYKEKVEEISDKFDGPKARFYSGSNYTGSVFELGEGNYEKLDKGVVNSIRIPNNMRVVVYDRPNFSGNSAALTKNTSTMKEYNLENGVVSTRIEKTGPETGYDIKPRIIKNAPRPSGQADKKPELDMQVSGKAPPSDKIAPAVVPLALDDPQVNPLMNTVPVPEPVPQPVPVPQSVPAPQPEPVPVPAPVSAPSMKRTKGMVSSEQVAKVVVEPFCGVWGAERAAKL